MSSRHLLRRVAGSTLLNATETSASTQLDPVDEQTLAVAREILEACRAGGEAALRATAVRLKELPSLDAPLIATKSELKAAYDGMSSEDRALLDRTASRVRAFAQAQRDSVRDLTGAPIPGGVAGHKVIPVDVAGCYAPGGRYPLPSSVIMTAVTARVAGVKQVVVASPRPQQVTLAAAHVAGADCLLRVGGAQAIAAFAFGLGGIPQCDVIVGPGNRYVTAAKQLVSGRCGIDMLAGPSECLVWCDETTNPAVVAADLLAQAEHDEDAVPIIVTHAGEEVIRGVERELELQLATLPTAPTARKAVAKGYAVACASHDEARRVCDFVGPEHLEVMTKTWRQDADLLTKYGGLFVGPRAAEVFGDYGAGPNHVLPTSGTARYTGGLSVFTFVKIVTWMRIENERESQVLVQDAARLARLEGLEGHARSAEKRLLGSKL